MKRFAKIFLLAAVALCGCGEDSEPSRSNTLVPLTSLETAIEPSSVPTGTYSRITATGNFSGVFTRDLSDEVVWTSSDPAVATVGEEPGDVGVIFANAPGRVTLTAETEGFTSSAYRYWVSLLFSPGRSS